MMLCVCLPGSLVCSGRKGISTANSLLPGCGRAYEMTLLTSVPNAGRVARAVKPANFIS